MKATKTLPCSISTLTVTATNVICFQIMRHIQLWHTDPAKYFCSLFSFGQSACLLEIIVGTIRQKELSKLESAALFVSSVEGKLNMYIRQWLRIVRGWASRKVWFTLGRKQEKCCESKEMMSGFIGGHSPGPGCPKITAHCQSSCSHA